MMNNQMELGYKLDKSVSKPVVKRGKCKSKKYHKAEQFVMVLGGGL